MMEGHGTVELMGVVDESSVVSGRSPARSGIWSEDDGGSEAGAMGKDVVIEICASAGTRAPRRGNCGTKSRATCEGVRGTPITGKRLGEAAEAAFVAKVAEMGFGVAKPWGDSDPYDFITQSGKRLCRVQVKSSYRAGKDGSYSFRAHGHALEAYGEDEIDVLVAYVVPMNVWYVFPVSVVQGLRSLKLFPGSRRRRSKYEKYREAWGRMVE
jgi:hypothetical protein